MSLRSLLPLVAGLVLAAPALAQDAWFVEGAVAERDTYALTAGLKWNGDWRRQWVGTEVSGAVDLQLSGWFWERASGGNTASAVVAVVPLLRLRFDEGRSPWFVEGGIGLSLAHKKYNTPEKQFSTAWNFYDVLAVGRSLGSDRRQELSLRITHVSNGSIKRPNPGENFLQLRYSRAL